MKVLMELKSRMDVKIFLFGCTYASIFGFSFMFTKIALPQMEQPVNLIFWRMAIAFFFMTVLRRFRVISVNFKGKPLAELTLLCLFQPLLYFIFETVGVKYLPSSQAGIMISTIPIFVLLFARIILKEQLNKRLIFFVVLSFLGVVIINLNNITLTANMKGIGALLVAVISGALYTTLAKKASMKFTGIEITYFMMLFGMLSFGGLSLAFGIIQGNLSLLLIPFYDITVMGAILYLGILSSCVAFLLLNTVVSHIEASKASVFSNLTTVVSIFAGVLLLGEQLSMIQYIGCLVIIIGVYGAQRSKMNLDV